MAEPDRKPFLTSFPDALFIAGLTALAYWLSFSYEAAYLRVFALPPELVEVSLQSTLLVGFVFYGTGWALFWFINPMSMFWSDNLSLQRKLVPLALTIFICLWWLLSYGFRREDLLLYIVYLGIGVGLTLLAGGYDRQWQQSLNSSPPLLIDRLRTASGPTGYTIIICVPLGTFLADVSGRAKAETKKEFFLFSDYPETP